MCRHRRRTEKLYRFWPRWRGSRNHLQSSSQNPVDWFLEFAPWLISMGVLLCASGFFSASEAALFYLTPRDRAAFESGGRSRQIAAALLKNADRLLTAVLFWNLLINISYFTIASILSISLQRSGQGVWAGAATLISLLAIILFGEMLPKSVAVLHSRMLASLVAVPLAIAVRAIDPLIPLLRTIQAVSMRVFLPRFKPEPYLQVQDLERAVEMSEDTELVHQEELALQNILSLSELSVEEIMQPRMLITTKSPPVSINDLESVPPGNGYLFISEPDTEEIAAAVPLALLPEIPDERLDRYAEKVRYMPWSATAAAALEELRASDRRVIVVVNEHGESLGVLTYDDVLDAVFSGSGGKTARLSDRAAIAEIGPKVWQVSGMTRLRRLAKTLGIEYESGKSVTVAGAMQDQLQRVPRRGDECTWCGLRLHVLENPFRGQLTIKVTFDPHAPAKEERE